VIVVLDGVIGGVIGPMLACPVVRCKSGKSDQWSSGFSSGVVRSSSRTNISGLSNGSRFCRDTLG
jgi:hypothetical protein